MKRELTTQAFTRLLERLGDDEEQAAKKYEDLRHTLIRFFEWRGAPFPEEHADETFNRLARKLDEGVEIRNIGEYAYTVARLVWLEALKGSHKRLAPLDEIQHEPRALDTSVKTAEREARLNCLDGQTAQARPAKNCFGNQRTCQQAAELQTQNSRDRQHGVAQRVL